MIMGLVDMRHGTFLVDGLRLIDVIMKLKTLLEVYIFEDYV